MSATPTNLRGTSKCYQQQPTEMQTSNVEEWLPPVWTRFVHACRCRLTGQALPANLKMPQADISTELEVSSWQRIEQHREARVPRRGDWWQPSEKGLVPRYDSEGSRHLPEWGQWDPS